MAKLTLPDLGSNYASVAQLQAAFDLIEDHLNTKILYRVNPEGGTTNNKMANDLDMNGYDILNVGDIQAGTVTSSGVTIDLVALEAALTNYTTLEARIAALEALLGL